MALMTAEKKNYELQIFRKLLCAFYNRPCKINSVAELKDITGLADFYYALPIVSATSKSFLVLNVADMYSVKKFRLIILTSLLCSFNCPSE